ncbi:hypothetical protein JK232_02450 [Nissabacter archeti]|uniref:DUF551 domain-containing protein n=1 Tax=Nissabacter archeti TaxID=1917880 RepID=A0ABS5JCR5_9GAMM|nr:hypothetical protein [Nissabacter archeti]MBS0967745.1 hypothetical protein [Nissabacter archeti]
MNKSHQIKEMQVVIDNWKSRAEAAEAELDRLRELEPIGKVRLGEYDDCGNYPDAAVVCLHESAHWDNFPEGYALYAAPPAPVVRVPDVDKFCHGLWPHAVKALEDYRNEVLRLNSQG